MTDARWWVLGVSLAVSGCGASARPLCERGESVACACPGGVAGVQACGEGGYGACACPTRCVEGALFSCTCTDGSSGAQRCSAGGTFEPCDCAGPVVGTRCVPGSAAPCGCTDGSQGAQLCGDDFRYGECECAPPGPASCVPGIVHECRCDDGWTSRQICQPDGAFPPCECGYLDAGPAPDTDMPDASREVPACNPYLTPGACGCPEVLPPASPTTSAPSVALTVAMGTGAIVDAWALEAGVLVVLTTGVRVHDRSGAEVARWDAPRALRAAVADPEHVVVADGAGLTVLGADLAPAAPILTRWPCDALALVSCDRVVCSAGSRLEVYDLTTGVGGGMLDSSVGGPELIRVPGVDGVIVSGSSGYSDRYVRVDPDGRAIETGTSSPSDFSLPLGLVGRPAVHAVDAQGALHRLDDCVYVRPWSSRRCFERDGTLGTFASGETFVGLDGGADGILHALVAASSGSAFDDSICSTGCSLQRIDVAARLITTRAPFAVVVRRGRVIFRHDPWSDAAVVATPTTCASSYPYTCTGYRVVLAPYE